MKYLAIIPVLLCMLMLIGCKKTLPPDNRPSVVDIKIQAGDDQWVELPKNETILQGSILYAGSGSLNITTAWSKVSGPASFFIENPDSLQTKLKNLVEGIYQFELKGLLPNGTIAKDTVKIIVHNNNTSYTYNIKMHAGNDKLVEFPLTEVTLNGSYSYSGTTQLSITTHWSMVSGPRSVIIENPDSLNTKIKNLILGIYEFELKGKLMNGSVFKDTVKVIVNRLPASTREIVVNDLTWIFPWYNAVEIKNFYNLAPDFVPDTYFNLYIQRPPSNDWVQVEEAHNNATSSIYQYYYSQGSMYIFYYGQDVSDKPSIKIVY